MNIIVQIIYTRIIRLSCFVNVLITLSCNGATPPHKTSFMKPSIMGSGVGLYEQSKLKLTNRKIPLMPVGPD